MPRNLLFWLAALLLALPRPALAQRENVNWYFGAQAGLTFPVSGPATALTNGAMTTSEACAAVSDNTGQLLFYTEGINIWTRSHTYMANGTNLGGHVSATQGVAIVQNPGNPQQYYVFSLDAFETVVPTGFKYCLVDMTRQGGAGEVLSARNQLLPGRQAERVTTTPHANGRDTWVLVHEWPGNTFYAFLVTPLGVQPPVLTSIGALYGPQPGLPGANIQGYMRFSPNGHQLAVAPSEAWFELLDFDPATGQLTNYRVLPVPPSFNSALQSYASYGVEFSPDGHLLYGTGTFGGGICQFDLQAGSTAAIAASVRQVGGPTTPLSALQNGPDGRLYACNATNNARQYLAGLTQPNQRGTASGYQSQLVYLGGALAAAGLPNYPSSQVVVPTNPTLAFAGAGACAGELAHFTATPVPAPATATFSWDFGDPASGSANAATGLTATHRYPQAGTYQVSFTAQYSPYAPVLTLTQALTVAPPPTVRLGRDTALCARSLLLAPTPQPAGSTYRWQDGSTAPTLLATASGRYRLTVTSPQGCAATDSLQLTLWPPPTPRLPADTAACPLPLRLDPGPQPAGSTYAWQDGSTAPTYLVPAAGTYTVRVTTPQGCAATATTRVRAGTPLSVSLGADTLVCPLAVWTLRPSPQPAGTTYRWQDGSTTPTYLAHGPGRYTVRVQAGAGGCQAQATVLAAAQECPEFIPNIITPNGDGQNECFVVQGLVAAEWELRVFTRWGRLVHAQAAYDNGWNAAGQAAGLYYYWLRQARTGAVRKGWVEVVR